MQYYNMIKSNSSCIIMKRIELEIKSGNHLYKIMRQPNKYLLVYNKHPMDINDLIPKFTKSNWFTICNVIYVFYVFNVDYDFPNFDISFLEVSSSISITEFPKRFVQCLFIHNLSQLCVIMKCRFYGMCEI